MPYNLTLKDRLLAKTGVLLLKLIYASCKKEFHYAPEALKALGERRNFIVAFWHDLQLMLPFLFLDFVRQFGPTKFSMLISAHRDGRLIAEAIKSFGLDSIAGSSSKNARSASKAMVEELLAGHMVGITPDGPKGPRHEAKDGIFKIAEIAQVEIIPVSLAASRCWRFRSWDKMLLPKPFSKIDFYVEKPILFSSANIKDQLQVRLSRASSL
jgi:lysophospholipid acyltransferase (LPLAT)-like uncharacterized protein